MVSNKPNTEPAQFKNAAEDIPSEYVLQLGGQKFIRFAGLMYLLQRKGEFRVQTTRLSATDDEVVYEAKAWLIPSDNYLAEKGISLNNPCISLLLEPTIAHATSSTMNTSPNMRKFREALAETRAIARAFRILSGSPYTAVDELDRSDFKNMSKSGADFDEYGVSVQTMEDMLAKQGVQVQKSPQGNGQTTFASPPTSRKDLLTYLKEAKGIHKGVAEFINSYLDSHNAAMLENLNVNDLQEVYEKVKTLMTGAQ